MKMNQMCLKNLTGAPMGAWNCNSPLAFFGIYDRTADQPTNQQTDMIIRAVTRLKKNLQMHKLDFRKKSVKGSQNIENHVKLYSNKSFTDFYSLNCSFV